MLRIKHLIAAECSIDQWYRITPELDELQFRRYVANVTIVLFLTVIR